MRPHHCRARLPEGARRAILQPVKLGRMPRTCCFLLIAGVFLLNFTAVSQTKQIRLRTGVITTVPAAQTAVAAARAQPQAPVSGLFLVQFENQIQPVDRAALRALGVELVKYVPDDTFIARFNNVSADSVRALSSVRWVGPYAADYKIHPGLAAMMRGAARTNPVVAVSVMLSPSATAAEIAAVRGQFAAVQSDSRLRQGIFLRGELPPGRLNALAQSGAVLWIENAPKHKLVDEAASKLVGGDDGNVATPTLTQQLGFDGANVIVSVADTGLDTGDTNDMHPDLAGRVAGLMFYTTNVTDASDGYGHGTHCAGIVAGNAASLETDPDSGQFYGLGVASGASLFIQRIFDDNANELDFTSDETLTHDAVRHGAKIGSNSWGNDVQGDYDLDCAQFDELVRDADAGTPGDQPYIEEFSAGNAGPQSGSIGSPAAAKNVIATGASENVPNTLAATYGLYADGPDTMCDFSSRGPCADGRIKPDLVAPGSWIASAASRITDETGVAWTVIDDLYVYMGGTSMSGPHAAGAAAVFVQFYKSTHTNAMPSPALVKAALINSADELDQANGGPGPAPNNDEGWGRINLANIAVTNVNAAPRFFQYVDQTALLTNGQVYSQHIFVQGAGEPLKITLTYTDVPGFPGAIPALVNDLDLEVVAPDGTLYRGNQFGAGESVPNAPSPDKLNNVEGVYLAQPVPGDYLIRVRASKVVQDAVSSTPAIDQDFALVASGDLVRPGTGFILLDRPSYTAPGTMLIGVFDAARAGGSFVVVGVTNLTSHLGTTNLLHASGNYGAFTGAVATVTGPAGAGQIQIANGDNLEADYFDSGGIKRIATAVADLAGPNITPAGSLIDVGVLTVVWQTSEPATSIVHYGTNSNNLNLGATNLSLVTSHVVKLTGLIPGATYYYLVISSDTAGNVTTNNANLTFIGVAAPTVLLVDAYDTAAESVNGATVIPDSVYTNVFTSAGISYGFWKVNDRGSPQLADLKPFPVVVWRTTDDIIYYGVDADGLPDPTATNNTLNAQQQFMIQTYLNGGGAFFMASMGILSQLGDVPFRRNVLQVAGFVQNPQPPAQNPNGDEDHGVPAIIGAPASSAAGMNMTLDYTNYPYFDFEEFSLGPDFSDTFTPSSAAAAVTLESASGKPCGMSYPNMGADSPGRVVFLSFPFDALPTDGPATNNAAALLRNIITFLAPGANGRGVVFLDNTVYTTNEAVTVEVGDSDLAGAGQTQVTFGSNSRTNRTTITLFETTHPGLFEGLLTLVSGVAATNQLRVQNGDTITATYFDASANSNVTVTATIDTVSPVITNVAAATDYYNAQVTWLTSKPADSAVGYSGLPQPPANSVHNGAFVTNHSLTISGLLPNHVYYFEVVSRDQAGNTAEDDNHGNFYTFQTLKPPAPPWFDNLEHGTNGWTVIPDPGSFGSDQNWGFGTPNNGLVTSAHSGTNAWGSDLDGNQNFTVASSFLYAPVIDLSGLSSATLTFSNVFDFTRSDSSTGMTFWEEDGGVLISTNASIPPSLALPTAVDYYGQAAHSWTKETVDLTPWVGQTIQVVFYYQSFPLGDTIYGWTIDDIGITGVVAGGNVSITKNLGQGIWSLSSLSPIGLVPVQSGATPSVTISNVAAGQYVMEFGGVPYYQTPDSQTNSLTVGSTANFTGNYTFLDANSNGIPDSWERDYFGSVVTNRTQATDTDHDGMSDYAEFIAGTNPTNAASRFYFTQAGRTNNLVQLEWTVASNRLYQVSASTNLSNWPSVTAWLQASNSSTMTFTVTNTGDGSRFYRVQVQP
jgi:hypothetical protein